MAGRWKRARSLSSRKRKPAEAPPLRLWPVDTRPKKCPEEKCSCTCTPSATTGRMVAMNKYSPPEPETINVIPDKYRSGVTIEVAGESVRRDFDLRGK